jgi:hypothetical protein
MAENRELMGDLILALSMQHNEWTPTPAHSPPKTTNGLVTSEVLLPNLITKLQTKIVCVVHGL